MKRRFVLAGVPGVLVGAAALGCGPVADAAPRVPAQLWGVEPPRRVAMVAFGAPGGVRRTDVAAVVRALPEGGGIALGVTAFRDVPRTRRPRQLAPMPGFAGDLLDPQRTGGDVLVQVGGKSEADVREAVGRVLRGAPGWKVRWRIDGFRERGREENGRGIARNPFHFDDGFGNPNGERGIADTALVRAGDGEPEWAVGGSYQVVRVVRLATALWDRDSVEEQERIIGRRRDGRWLDGTPVGERPEFGADPRGRATPLDSHVRLAAPDRHNPPPLVRRSYAYDRGDADRGVLFSCFQRDLAAGFEAVQARLAGVEAMAKYTLTVGGGYFFVPPAGDGWVRRVFGD